MVIFYTADIFLNFIPISCERTVRNIVLGLLYQSIYTAAATFCTAVTSLSQSSKYIYSFVGPDQLCHLTNFVI